MRIETVTRLLNLWEFMTKGDESYMTWLQLNHKTFESFNLCSNHITTLIKGGVIEKQRYPKNKIKWEYRWIGKRPSLLTVNKMMELMYHDYPQLITKKGSLQKDNPSTPITKEKRTLSFQDKEGITWYREVEVSCSENNGYLLCAFPTNLANKILTLTGQELLLQD